MSGLILRLCLWCSFSVAHTEFSSLNLSDTHTHTHCLTVYSSLSSFLLLPFHFLFIFSFSLFLSPKFPQSSPVRFIFLIHLNNSLSHSPAVVDSITGLTCLTIYKCSCDVYQALGGHNYFKNRG